MTMVSKELFIICLITPTCLKVSKVKGGIYKYDVKPFLMSMAARLQAVIDSKGFQQMMIFDFMCVN